MRQFFLAVMLLLPGFGCGAATYQNSPITPPPVAREFRGLWIATVGNIDWPSKPGLSAAQQKAELVSILNRAAQLKLNAIIFQVRPACDAMYPSQLEPWSEYLSGVMGKAPEPYYDPLAFAIEEAHKRGMELHAWFNPYRALHKSHVGNVSAGHISKKRSDLVHSYGEYLWLDPGERDVQDYSLRVVLDVVKRYDIDGVQFDDYFYPDPTGVNREFNDEASWRKFGAATKLSREDWRRQNVDTFIERVYTSIKGTKPWVKFGISPFGIWRPGNPAQITGSDAYNKFFADSRKWLMNGWLDYCSPQLYWQIGKKEQSFPVLLDWWSQQNVKRRHLWPGISVAYMVSQEWSPNEVPEQIRLVRKGPGSDGYIFYNSSSLGSSNILAQQLQRNLQTNVNAQPAIVPASPWLGGAAPAKPTVTATGTRLDWASGGTNSVRWWIVQTKSFSDWKTEVFPGDVSSKALSVAPEVVAITAIDRAGNASPSRVLQISRDPSKERILLKK